MDITIHIDPDFDFNTDVKRIEIERAVEWLLDHHRSLPNAITLSDHISDRCTITVRTQ